jgi:hypothetical protein
MIRHAMLRRIDPARIVPTAADELATLFGDALRSLLLYGSAAGPGFQPGRSDINLAAVLDPLALSHLERAAQWSARWRRERVAAPLLLSPHDLERARTLFPLEMLDIQACHRTLAGAELFRGLVVAPDRVRAECEREARGKLMRLRELYLELAGSTRELRALMFDSRKTFLPVLRGLLHLRGEPWIADGRALVDTFDRHFGCPLPILGALAAATGSEPFESRFGAYLDEIERLVAITDREAATR